VRQIRPTKGTGGAYLAGPDGKPVHGSERVKGLPPPGRHVRSADAIWDSAPAMRVRPPGETATSTCPGGPHC
jgi:hypothetical protein